MGQLDKRLEIRLDERQFVRLEDFARKRKRRIASVVREAIDEKLRRTSIEERMAVVEAIGRMQAPVSDWEQMETEIEAGGK